MKQVDQLQTLFFAKALFELKASVLLLSFNIYIYIFNCKKLQTVDYASGDMLNFNFQKSVWKKFFHYFLCIIFQETYSFCYILLTNQISLPDCLLNNACIAIVFFPQCDAISYEINLTFPIKLFFYMAKSQDKNLNALRTKKAFKVK